MDRLTTIEDVIASVLHGIDKTEQTNGYTYYTKTGNVSIDDEVIANAVNRSKGSFADIDYSVEQFGAETNEEWGEGTNVYTNETIYEITAKVKNDSGVILPKREIKKKCNEVLSDLKFAFAHNTTLDGNANWIKYSESERRYTTSNDAIRTANLVVYFQLNYGQSFQNPDLVGCN